MKYKINNIVTILLLALSVSFLECFSVSKASENKNTLVENQLLTEVLDSESLLKSDLYILGPGDILNIKFIGVSELSGSYEVMKDGKIQLPLIGTQSINGLTLDEAKLKLVELYEKDLLVPRIDLSLRKPRPVRVAVVGEVDRPGSYVLADSLASQTVVDAIQKSGGLTFESDITNISLYRKVPGAKGEMKKTNLDLLNMIRTGDQSNNPFLFDGDVIKIVKLTDKKNKIENIPNNLTPETVKVYVIGEVKSPGMLTVDAKTRISQAILIAGGPRNWRYQDKIQLLRVNRNGAVDIEKISFNKQGLSKKMDSLSLRNGDIIRVKTNTFGKITDSSRVFLPAIRDIYSLYGVYKLIND